MRHAIGTAVALVALPVLASPAAPTVTDVCHPVHHHVAVHVRKPATHEVAGMAVVVDQARLVSFPQPVKTVFVGNPTVVDVSMVDPQHAFLLGKTFGVTNMIALGADGKQISNQQVTVHNNWAAVTINRGADQFNYMCTAAHCETAPRPGDPQTYAQNTEAVSTLHENTASAGGAAAATQAPSN